MIKAKAAIERRYVVVYWTVGKAMNRYLKSSLNTHTTRSLAYQLSEDLNIHHRTLEQSVQFYRVYPKLNRRKLFTWSHYRHLISIDSPKERLMWENRILTQDITSKELPELLSQSRRKRLHLKTKPLLVEPKKGKLYHYRLIKVNTAHEAPGGMMVDCGFSNRIMPPQVNWPLNVHRLVLSEKTGDGYTLKIANITKEDIFTYRAFIERVIDGDTLLTEVDCGFGIYSRQYLRLRGIDAPELSTTAGLRAKRFVERQIKEVPFITIKTEKKEKYGRYLADVWIGATYLNQLLLDKGLAGVYRP